MPNLLYSLGIKGRSLFLKNSLIQLFYYLHHIMVYFYIEFMRAT